MIFRCSVPRSAIAVITLLTLGWVTKIEPNRYILHTSKILKCSHLKQIRPIEKNGIVKFTKKKQLKSATAKLR